MTATAIALVEVGPFEDTAVWTDPPICDLCLGRGDEDLRDGKAVRRFWRQVGGVDDGFTVGACCADEFLAEPML
jgi:hypothetical protein